MIEKNGSRKFTFIIWATTGLKNRIPVLGIDQILRIQMLLLQICTRNSCTYIFANEDILEIYSKTFFSHGWDSNSVPRA